MSLNRSVSFRSGGRAARRVVAGAAALVLTLSLAAPVQAAPLAQDSSLFSSILAKVQRWFEGLAGPSPPPAEDGPISWALPEGCDMDPNGSQCASADDTEPDAPDTGDRPTPTSG